MITCTAKIAIKSATMTCPVLGAEDDLKLSILPSIF